MSSYLSTPVRGHQHESTVTDMPGTASTTVTASTSISSPETVSDGPATATSSAPDTPQKSRDSVDEIVIMLGDTKLGPSENIAKEQGTMTPSSSSDNGSHAEGFVHNSTRIEDPFTNANTVAVIYQVRSDRAGEEPSNLNAQGIFGPEACVFIANLAQNLSDMQLERGVTIVFSQFGNVWVKIRRDPGGLPFAFAQFETEEIALTAIEKGRNKTIWGRPCRTERARVNRAIYMSKISGGIVTEAEARQILSKFGAIEEVWYSTATDREVNNLPQGIWIRFHFFDDSRDALAALRDDAKYRVEQPRNNSGGRNIGYRHQQGLNSANSLTSPHGTTARRVNETGPMYLAYRQLPEGSRDTRSIFVGNLAINCSHYDLYQMFSQFGGIVDVTLLHKPTTNAAGVTAYCFVEYADRKSAEYAVSNSAVVFPALRVEFKGTRRTLNPIGGDFKVTATTQPNSMTPWIQPYQGGISNEVFTATRMHQPPAAAQNSQVQAFPAPNTVLQYSAYHPHHGVSTVYGTGVNAATFAQATQPYYPMFMNNNGATNGLVPVSTQNSEAEAYPGASFGTTYVWPPEHNADSA